MLTEVTGKFIFQHQSCFMLWINRSKLSILFELPTILPFRFLCIISWLTHLIVSHVIGSFPLDSNSNALPSNLILSIIFTWLNYFSHFYHQHLHQQILNSNLSKKKFISIFVPSWQLLNTSQIHYLDYVFDSLCKGSLFLSFFYDFVSIYAI
jgi:hypothetical protein